MHSTIAAVATWHALGRRISVRYTAEENVKIIHTASRPPGHSFPVGRSRCLLGNRETRNHTLNRREI